MNNKGNESHFIVLGKIGSPYGIKGWVKISPFNDRTDNMMQYKPWFIGDNKGTWKETKLESVKAYGKGYIAKFATMETPEAVRTLTGKSIGVLRTQLPALPKNEYYWADLEGLTVINHHGQTLGKISYIIETGSNDVLVVKGDKEIAIPYLLEDVIKHIDLEKQEMLVEWEEL